MEKYNAYDGYKYPSEITDQHIQTYLDDMKNILPTWEHQMVDGVLYLTKIRKSDGKLLEDYTNEECTPFGVMVPPSSILESVNRTAPKKVSSATQMSKVEKALHMFRECGVTADVDDDNSIYIYNIGDCQLEVQVSTAEVAYRAEQYDMMYESKS